MVSVAPVGRPGRSPETLRCEHGEHERGHGVRIAIDAHRCEGHARCLPFADRLIEFDDQGYASVIGDGEVAAGQVKAAESAAMNCPEDAISLLRD